MNAAYRVCESRSWFRIRLIALGLTIAISVLLRESLSNTRVILCVDDEAAMLAVRCLVLSSAGYEVLTAADGAAALEIFRCIQVDLVITDYRLPRLTGTRPAAEMKRLKAVGTKLLPNPLPASIRQPEHCSVLRGQVAVLQNATCSNRFSAL